MKGSMTILESGSAFRSAHQVGNLDHAIGAGLPGHDGHLLLDGLHVGRVVWLRAVAEAHDALSVLADLARPVLRRAAQNSRFSMRHARERRHLHWHARCLQHCQETWSASTLLLRMHTCSGQTYGSAAVRERELNEGAGAAHLLFHDDVFVLHLGACRELNLRHTDSLLRRLPSISCWQRGF